MGKSSKWQPNHQPGFHATKQTYEKMLGNIGRLTNVGGFHQSLQSDQSGGPKKIGDDSCRPDHNPIHTMWGPPSYVSWFITPMKTIVF